MRKQFFLSLCAVVFFAANVKAQWLEEPRSTGLWRATEAEEREDNPGAYFKWFYGQRSFGSNGIPEDALVKAQQAKAAMMHRAKGSMLASGPNWKLVGPKTIADPGAVPTAHAGRVNTIAVHPTNPKIVYAGAAAGGVWKSTDGAHSWKPLTDDQLSLGMGALAIDPVDPNIIYAGTGEFVQGDSYNGYGIMKSTDAGLTWKNMGPSHVAAWSRIVIDPKNSSVIYAGGARSGGGVFKSTDAGKSWARLGGSVPQAEVNDLAIGYDGATQYVYAAIAGHGIFLSKDGGENWDNVHPDGDMRRIHIDIMPNDPKTTVTTYSNFGLHVGDIEFSEDAGGSWSSIASGQVAGAFDVPGGDGQGSYDIYIKIDPTDSRKITLGGVSIWQTQDRGESWSDVGGAYSFGDVHPDQHTLAFAPSDPTIAYSGSDGGVAISSNAGVKWSIPSDNLAITQFYAIAIDQNVDDLTYGGTQDNGTVSGGASADWEEFTGGDGSYVCVDEKNSNRIYYVRPGANQHPWRSLNGNNVQLTTGLTDDKVNWLKPLVLDSKSSKLYYGTTKLYYMNTSASSWTTIGKVFSKTDSTTLSAIEPFGDGKTLVVGSTGGRVWYTTDHGAAWKEVSQGLPGRWITSLKFSPTDNKTFYVTLSGFGTTHVMKTTDAGANYTDISSTLPDIPCNKIVMDPENPSVLYIGTDVGVFFSANDGAEWIPYGVGLPNVPVLDMEIHKTKRVLRVGTHGRSLWEIPLSTSVAGITAPAAGTVWTIGQPAYVSWTGIPGAVSIDLISDGKTTTIAKNVTSGRYDISRVDFLESQNVYIQIKAETSTLTSPLFQIMRVRAGAITRTVGDVPIYLYDIAYDQEHNVLWGTNFSPSSNSIYKIDPDNGKILGTVNLGTGKSNLTGIKWDPVSKHLFIQQANSIDATHFSSDAFEVGTDGKGLKSITTPSEYGTGIYALEDTLYYADRMSNSIHRTNRVTHSGYSDLELERKTTLGPRALAYNANTKEFLHTWTDFNGPASPSDFGQSVLFDSYLLSLDVSTGAVSKAYVLQVGGESVNVRGCEWDPRNGGKEVWLTLLESGGASAKLVKLTLEDGPEGTGIVGVAYHGATGFALKQNYPNPFNPSTSIPYVLTHDGNVEIKVYDDLGRMVYASPARYEHSGNRERTLDLGSLPSASYTYVLEIDGARVASRKMMLMK